MFIVQRISQKQLIDIVARTILNSTIKEMKLLLTQKGPIICPIISNYLLIAFHPPGYNEKNPVAWEKKVQLLNKSNNFPGSYTTGCDVTERTSQKSSKWAALLKLFSTSKPNFFSRLIRRFSFLVTCSQQE